MPVNKVSSGYRWGQSGKIYPTKSQAQRQGRAAYASGYDNGGIVQLDANGQQYSPSTAKDGILERAKNLLIEQMKRGGERTALMSEAQTKLPTPSAGQVANFSAMLAPGAGIYDAKHGWPALPSGDQPLSEALSGEKSHTLDENLARGGFGGYTNAFLQGLGAYGDMLFAVPFAGPFLGTTVGTGAKGIAALGKLAKAATKADKASEGIIALDEAKQLSRLHVDQFAKDDLGFISPTIQALIEKAPVNLKGQQIFEWAKGNTNVGVRPQELEILGLEEFVTNNPNAITREAVAGISGNKIRVSKAIYSGDDADLEFDVDLPDLDPLDRTPLHQFETDNLLDSINSGDEFEIEEVISIFNQSNPQAKAKTIDEIDNFLTSKGEDFEDFIDNIGKSRYDNSPYEMVTPHGEQFGKGTFAFGNEEVGYSLFVDGNRVTNKDNIAYSRAEAQIQLREALGLDEYSYGGGTRFKSDIDNSLPGGENYREVVFNWDNAPVEHNIGHFDNDPTQIAHALIRDRVLDDGTPSLHIDELQSDLHTEGSKKGYKPPQAEVRKAENEISELLDGISDKDFSSPNRVNYQIEGLGVGEKYVTVSDGAGKVRRAFSQSDIRYVNNTIENIKREPESRFPFKRQRIYGEIAYKPKEFLKKLKAEEIKKKEDILITDRAMTKTSIYGSPEADMLVEALGEDFHKLNDLFEPIRADIAGVPNYPFKDDYHVMVLKNMLLDAIEEGKPALSVSDSAPIKARWSERYHKFYDMLYDKKIPSAMKKLANKYGGEFEKGRLDVDDTFTQGRVHQLYESDPDVLQANIIRITPEMKAKILKDGLQSFSGGGIVDSGIAHLNTPKKKINGRSGLKGLVREMKKKGLLVNHVSKNAGQEYKSILDALELR